MKRTLSLIVILLISLALTSCSTLFVQGGSEYRQGMAAYQQRAYVQALQLFLLAWRINPDFPEARAMIPVAFNDGDSAYKQIVATIGSAGDPETLDCYAQAYTDLNELHRLARQSGFSGLSTVDYSKQAKEANQKASKLWFSLARNLHDGGDRQDIRSAVLLYERAKARDPQNAEIASYLFQAIDQATVTLMVLGIGSPSFHLSVYNDIKEGLNANRFVKVIETGNFSNVGDMVGPLDPAISWALSNGIDYLIEVNALREVKIINSEKAVRLPSADPHFAGVKKTIGYVQEESYTYRLFDLSRLEVVKEDFLKRSGQPYEFTVSFAKAEGLRELRLGNEPKDNLRYVTSRLDMETTSTVANSLRIDYYNIPTPMGVTNPGDQTQWLAYYRFTYPNFVTFAKEQSGKELFYAIEVIHQAGTEDYVMLGNSLAEAKAESQRNSGILNAQIHYALDLVKKESEKTEEPTYRYGVDIAKAIGAFL